MDREEFYRLKKVSGKKQRDAAEEDKARNKAKAAAASHERENRAVEESESHDLFGDKENEDVIF